MKSNHELKDEMHRIIDSIESEATLYLLHEKIFAAVTNDSIDKQYPEDALTEEEEKELDEAMRKADAGKNENQDEFLDATKRWLAK